jgi:hypothetical protein
VSSVARKGTSSPRCRWQRPGFDRPRPSGGGGRRRERWGGGSDSGIRVPPAATRGREGGREEFLLALNVISHGEYSWYWLHATKTISGKSVHSIQLWCDAWTTGSARPQRRNRSMIYSPFGRDQGYVYFSRSVYIWSARARTQQQDSVYDSQEPRPHRIMRQTNRVCLGTFSGIQVYNQYSSTPVALGCRRCVRAAWLALCCYTPLHEGRAGDQPYARDHVTSLPGGEGDHAVLATSTSTLLCRRRSRLCMHNQKATSSPAPRRSPGAARAEP